MNVNRFHKYQSNEEYRSKRVEEALGNTYKVHYPDHQPQTCRGAKMSVLHEKLRDANAYFRNVSGWESPAWYAPPGVRPVAEQESFGRENWFPYWEAEHRACRENVALFDMTFMSKFLVQGADAGLFLNRLSTANVDGECGKITYTQWLNERGYLEADLTVAKLDDDHFLVVATDTMHNHVHSHMMRRLNRNIHAFVSDVTGKYVQINIQGPRSRELMQSLTNHDMANFPFRRVADIEIGVARVLCTRITYVGELGYELFIPVEQALHVYDRIIEQGKDYRLLHAGLRALGSLRMVRTIIVCTNVRPFNGELNSFVKLYFHAFLWQEKGYRDYGHDMDNTDTVLECGLGFTCDFDKPGGFIGKEYVLAQKTSSKKVGGLLKRMAHVLVTNPDPLLHHGEILWRDDRRVSDIRSASYGHSVGGSVGLTMLENDKEPVTTDFVSSGGWQVEVAEQLYPCKVSFSSFYDPKGSRIKI